MMLKSDSLKGHPGRVVFISLIRDYLPSRTGVSESHGIIPLNAFH